eukprot:3259658-Amphidinium_carterae.1
MQVPVTVDHLLHAVVRNICRHVAQCYGTIIQILIANIHDYIDKLAAPELQHHGSWHAEPT